MDRETEHDISLATVSSLPLSAISLPYSQSRQDGGRGRSKYNSTAAEKSQTQQEKATRGRRGMKAFIL